MTEDIPRHLGYAKSPMWQDSDGEEPVNHLRDLMVALKNAPAESREAFYIALRETALTLTPEEAAEQIARDAAKPRPPNVVKRDSVVYYVRIGAHIKIGVTTNIEQRLKSFYIDHIPDSLLATEPGDSHLETERHREFAEERVFANRELFDPSPRLLAHIDSLKASAA